MNRKNPGPTCMQLGDRCRSAGVAFDKASRALDVALRREGGATAAEWKAEDDARVDLRAAREAYVDESSTFAANSTAYWHLVSRQQNER